MSAAATFRNYDEVPPLPKLNSGGFQNAWTLAKNGICFIARADDALHKIKFCDLLTEQISEIAETDKFSHSGFAGVTVAPDGKTIVFAQFDRNASRIMLAAIKE